MVLVTGGTGLVGAHLLYRLCLVTDSDVQIRAIYRSKKSIQKTEAVFHSYGEKLNELGQRIQWLKADLLEIPKLSEALIGAKEVYHCAAAIDADLSFEEIKRVNVEGTRNLVNLCIKEGIEKFCHVSSIATLESDIAKNQVNEEDDFNIEASHTDYAISKYGAELEVWRASQEGLNTIIVNPGVVLGEGIYDQGSGQIISKYANGLSWYTSGSSGFVYVADVVAAMIQLMQSNINTERFIIVAENLQFKQLAYTIRRQAYKEGKLKKIPKWLLLIAARVDQLYQFFTSKHFLSLAEVETLYSQTFYDNYKSIQVLGLDYTPMDIAIEKIVSDYQRQHRS